MNLKKLYPTEFNSYSAAIQRINGTNPRGMRWYRGVEMRFNSFAEFLDHIGPKPGPEFTLDRIDTAGHYEPGNVRWATRKQQNANRRSSRQVTWQGETRCIADWEQLKGWRVNFLRARLNRGWSVEKAMTHALPQQERELVAHHLEMTEGIGRLI